MTRLISVWMPCPAAVMACPIARLQGGHQRLEISEDSRRGWRSRIRACQRVAGGRDVQSQFGGGIGVIQRCDGKRARSSRLSVRTIPLPVVARDAVTFPPVAVLISLMTSWTVVAAA